MTKRDTHAKTVSLAPKRSSCVQKSSRAFMKQPFSLRAAAKRIVLPLKRILAPAGSGPQSDPSDQ